MSNTNIVTSGKLVNVKCKVNLSRTTKSITMLFKTKEIKLPKGLETVNSKVTVNPGPNHRLRIPVLNNFDHAIIFQKNITIGRLHQISNITLLQVKEHHTVASRVTNKVKSNIARKLIARKSSNEEKKLTQIFIFTPLCGASKGFMKALKTFIKPFEAPQRSAKIKI